MLQRPKTLSEASEYPKFAELTTLNQYFNVNQKPPKNNQSQNRGYKKYCKYHKTTTHNFSNYKKHKIINCNYNSNNQQKNNQSTSDLLQI